MSKIQVVPRLCIAAFFLLLLNACAIPSVPNAETLNVVASTQILGDVVSNIGGEYIQLTILIPPDSDPHAFEPAPRDAAVLSEADLVFINGLNLEEALQPLLEAAGVNLVHVSDGVVTIESISGGHDDNEEEVNEHEDEHAGVDPHVWMNPLNVKVWAENIATALAAADPAHAGAFRANAEAYKAELDALDTWAAEQLSLISSEDRLLVTDHESFGYFADHYGFEIIGALIPSLSTVSESSAGELAQLEDAIRLYGVQAIFVGSSMSPSLAERMAADTGVQVVFLYTESLSEENGPAPTYLDLLRFDVAAIVSALQ